VSFRAEHILQLSHSRPSAFPISACSASKSSPLSSTHRRPPFSRWADPETSQVSKVPRRQGGWGDGHVTRSLRFVGAGNDAAADSLVTLSLSSDESLVDGTAVGAFMATLQDLVAHPERML
jgi:hypothetical protein